MELNQLLYFQYVAKYENIGKAAEELHVTQPAISMSIKKLEEELNVSLFDRDKRNLRLNNCGRLFLKYVNNSLKELDSGVKKVKKLSHTEDNKLTVMIPSALISKGLMTRLYSAFPELTIQNLAIDHRFAKAQLGKYLDLCIVSPPIEGEGIETIIVEKQRFSVITSKEHPLADVDSCHLSDLANEKFIAFPYDYGPGKLLLKFCEKAGFVPDVCFESTSISTLLPPVQAGLGIALAPIAAYDGINLGDFHIINLEDDFAYGDLGLSFMAERKNDPTFSQAIEIITDCCRK